MQNEIVIEDKLDAFNWAWALWYWLSHNYGGQGCTKYAAMCSIPVENVPTIDFENNNYDEYEQAVIFYHSITEDNWENILEIFNYFLENKWEDD